MLMFVMPNVLKFFLGLTYFLFNSEFSYGQVCPGNRYNNNQQNETSTCMIWQNYNVKTFDDHGINFKSECAFTALTFNTGTSEFKINLGNKNCGQKSGCFIFLEILYKNKNYKLSLNDANIPTFSTDGEVYSIPSNKNGISIHQYTERVTVEFTDIGVTTKWDGKAIVEITIKNRNNYKISGLCGNNDKCSTNDQLLINKQQATTLTDFLKEWQVDKQTCPEITDITSSCKGDKSKEDKANRDCGLLRSDKFKAANEILDPQLYIEACIRDHCSCRLEKDINCVCDTFDAYAKASINAGIKRVSWRDSQLCPKKCVGDLIYYPCAPSVRQTCSINNLATASNTKCEEGCFCQVPTLLFKEKCYLKKNCPCSYGGKDYNGNESFEAGKCTTCTCIDGDVKCEARPSCIAATGTLWGDPHYTTFDGKKFDFMGKCAYYIVKGNDFSIEGDHYVLKNGQFIKDNSSAPSYTRRVIIRMAGQVVELKPELEVIVNDEVVNRFPHKAGDFIITKPSNSFVLVELPNKIQVQWDGYSTVIVRLPITMEGKVMGLLGTFTDDQSDDFLTPDGDIVDDPVTFGNSWKTEDSCQDTPNPSQHPCDANPSARGPAEKVCSIIKSDIFKSCEIEDIDTYYENCLYDTCYCKDNPDKCSCDLIAIVAERCGRKGIAVDWRNKISQCQISCPTGQVYQECGNACNRSCEDLSLRPTCEKVCVEGCNCAPGTTMDEEGQCIPIENCKCRMNGAAYPPGYKFLQSEDELRTCLNARWIKSVPVNGEDKNISSVEQLNEKCAADKHSVFTPCKYPTPRTCQNMHTYEIKRIDVCEEGCECTEEFVFNPATKTCVKRDECPCFEKGQSHEEGSVVKENCTTCICEKGIWKCNEENCDNRCHKENEVVQRDCNTCKCTNGYWQCTLKACLSKCEENSVKQEGCKKCTCEHGAWKCSEEDCFSLKCEKKP